MHPNDKTDHNVFCSLFEAKPGRFSTPKENFLTEALIYSLSAHKPAACAWVSLITGGEIRPRSAAFETRASYWDDDHVSIYPDVTVTGLDRSGNSYRLLVEHKWDSPYREAQLQRYGGLRQRGETLYLALVCTKKEDYLKAGKFRPQRRVRYITVRWEDVHRSLTQFKVQNLFLSQFLDFMETHGLSHGQPISAKDLIECARASPARNSLLRRQMRHCCQKLANEEWTEIPLPYRKNKVVRDNYGRSAVIFYPNDCLGPEIALGFYYDGYDHKVPFTNPDKGIDLSLRVYASPSKNPSPAEVLDLLGRRLPALEELGATVRLKNDLGNGNQWTLLIATKNLLDIIGSRKTEEEQVAAIYNELSGWCNALFSSPKPLMRAFGKIELC